MWDLRTGRLAREVRGHDRAVYAVAFSPDGGTLATGSGDGTVKLWDLAPRPDAGPVRLGDRGSGLAFRPGGGLVAAVTPPAVPGGKEPGTEVVLDVATGHTLFTVPPMSASALSPDGRSASALSPDGSLLATADRKTKTVRVWAVGTGRPVPTLPAGGLPGLQAWFVPGGRLAVAAKDHTVEVWDVGSGERLGRFAGHTEVPLGVALSPDGAWLATCSHDRTVRVWDRETGREVWSARQDPAAPIQRVTFSPDGARLASGDRLGGVAVWDAPTGAVAHRPAGHAGRVTAVAYSPDGRRLVTASTDCAVKVWDAATGQEVITLRSDEWVSYLEFSPDGRRLATLTSGPAEVRVWDATPLPDGK